MLETDLFEPVKTCLEAEGFAVAAEVLHCDVVAIRNEELVIVELKTSLNLKLVSQAVQRQSTSNLVYVAVPEPKRANRPYRASIDVVRRLGLGLITVYRSPLRYLANVKFKPNWQGETDEAARQALIKELSGRSVQMNVGGSTKTKILTAYRETAITIATLLSIHGPTRVRDLKPVTGDKTQSILSNNHYGWFERCSIGIYQVTSKGRQDIMQYPELYQMALALDRRKGILNTKA